MKDMMVILLLSFFMFQAECSSSNFAAEISSMMEAYQILSCKPGYALLSCGIDDLGYYVGSNMAVIIAKEAQGPGRPKYAHPINETTCACADLSMNNWSKIKLTRSSDLAGKYRPSNCVAWCYKSQNLTRYSFVATGSRLYTAMNSQCPGGSRAIGCQMQFGIERHESKLIEVGRFYYPTNERSCFCQDTIASKCISSCLGDDSIEGYDIVIGKGLDDVVMVTCPSGSVVLGCGIKPEFVSDDGHYERYPTTFVSGIDSCICHSRYNGAACYAVCAKRLK